MIVERVAVAATDEARAAHGRRTNMRPPCDETSLHGRRRGELAVHHELSGTAVHCTCDMDDGSDVPRSLGECKSPKLTCVYIRDGHGTT